jgi:hypothetical protein
MDPDFNSNVKPMTMMMDDSAGMMIIPWWSRSDEFFSRNAPAPCALPRGCPGWVLDDDSVHQQLP